MKAVRFNGTITSIRLKANKSISCTLHTPAELSPEERNALVDLSDANLDVLLDPQGSEPDAPPLKVDKELNQKTPSQRLRWVLFRLWEQEGNQGDFEAYYRTKMEGLIDFLKRKLD